MNRLLKTLLIFTLILGAIGCSNNTDVNIDAELISESDNQVVSDNTVSSDEVDVVEEVVSTTESDEDEEQYRNIAGFDYPIVDGYVQSFNISLFHALEGTWVAEGDESTYFKFFVDEDYCFELNIDSKYDMPKDTQYGTHVLEQIYLYPVDSYYYQNGHFPPMTDEESLLEIESWSGEWTSSTWMIIEKCGRYIKIWNEDETEEIYFHPKEARESLYKLGTPEFIEIFEKLQGVWVMEDGRYFVEFYSEDDIYSSFGAFYSYLTNELIEYEHFYCDPIISIYVHDPVSDERAIEGETHVSITSTYFHDTHVVVFDYYIADNGEYIRIASPDFSKSAILYPGDSSVVDNWFEEMGYERWY